MRLSYLWKQNCFARFCVNGSSEPLRSLGNYTLSKVFVTRSGLSIVLRPFVQQNRDLRISSCSQSPWVACRRHLGWMRALGTAFSRQPDLSPAMTARPIPDAYLGPGCTSALLRSNQASFSKAECWEMTDLWIYGEAHSEIILNPLKPKQKWFWLAKCWIAFKDLLSERAGF